MNIFMLASAAIDAVKGGVVDPVGGPTVDSALGAFVNLLSVLIGVFSVIMVMVGGFKYIRSSGEPQAAAGAKNTIVYALLGVAVAVMAQVIVKFVIAKATN